MNRKDTILVAVLINAGVLVVLFTSALKNKNSEKVGFHEEPIAIVQETKQELPNILKDEIDLAIEQARKEQETKETALLQVPQHDILLSQEALHEDDKAAGSPSSMTPVASFVEYAVKKGDFLAKIAKRFNVSVEEVMKVNHLKNSNLKIGQVLKIPQMSKLSETQTKPKENHLAQEPSLAHKYYTIKAGDNPWLIAKKHNMKVDELLKMNNLTAEKAKQLKVGDKLKVKA